MTTRQDTDGMRGHTWIILGTLTFSVACSTDADLRTGPSASLVDDTTFLELPVGTASDAGAITVSFDQVTEDSRCPSGVHCVWAGNAQVRITLMRGANTEVDSLNTTIDPRETEFAGYEISLIDVAPYPVYGAPIDPDDYEARLAVYAASSGS